MRFAVTVISLFLAVAVGFHKLADSGDSGTPRKAETCEKFWMYPSTVVCGDNLYHLQPGGRAYMGKLSQMTPIPVPTYGG